MASKTTVVEVKILTCRDLAFKCQMGLATPFWIPFSQLQDPDEKYLRECVGQEVEIEIPWWLAEEKGLNE